MKTRMVTKFVSIFVGVIIFVLIVVMGFKILGSRASDVEPRDVIISDLTQNSAKISWSTGSESQSVIEYGTSPTALNFFAPENKKDKNHAVDLTLLSSSTTYYFQIRVGDKKYDNGGVPWTFATKGTVKSIPSPTLKPTEVQPTPIQSVVVPNSSSSTKPSEQQSCKETDCQKIKAELGKGCTTQDYFKCVRALTPTLAP